jgi:hypothetical protein
MESYSTSSYTKPKNEIKPIYLTDEENNCGIIKYGNKTFLLDVKDRDNIINFDKKFVFVNEYDTYPSFSYNYRRVDYLDFIFNYNKDSVYYKFKNNNKYDLRRSNVEIYHHYHKNIIENYDVIEYINGHYSSMGQDANIMKNPLWKIKENNKEILLMYCEKDTICKICPNSYEKILNYETNMNNGKKLTWYKCGNGYIQTHNFMEGKLYYVHQVITGCYGNGKGTLNISVDHIDQDPLNNTWDNLRIATRKEQEQNCNGTKPGTKRERKSSAIDLPEGIRQDMMRKYVVYYHEYLNKEKTKEREFFKVEKHPKLDKIWIGTKSNKVSIQEKLSQINKIVDDLENDIYPEKKEVSLPKYVSLIMSRNKPHLVFEKRMDDKRLNVKMVLPENYELHEQLCILNEKVKDKYEGEFIDIE